MTDTSSNNKRIARNTLFLYFRMLFTMFVSLFTSRVVLQTLGVEDYGIYNVVGGIVAMFTVLSGSLSSAISRFITFALGKGDKKNLKIVFSTSVSIQVALAVIIGILTEFVGVWFLNEKMNIPDGRMEAANWVLQCSILTFLINLISVPYNATIVAHEKMSAFAYISILEVILKLIIVYLLVISPFDKLIIYAILLMGIAILIRIVYGIYCKRNFEEATYQLIWDKQVFREMLSFAGWNFLGNATYIVNTQGINMLINLFFGVSMNAARAVAIQVDNAVLGFVNNFTLALNPQITKSYAAGNLPYMFSLVNRGTKFAFYILYVFAVPFVLEAETILNLWLKNPPEHSVGFLRLVMFASLANVSGNELYYAIISTGSIKRYQLVVTPVGLLVFPLSWLAYELGANAEFTYWIFGIIYLSLNIIRLRFMKNMMNYSIIGFIKEVFTPICIVSVVSLIPPMFLVYLMNPSIIRLFIVGATSVLSIAATAYFLGFSKNEKLFIKNKIISMVNKVQNK